MKAFFVAQLLISADCCSLLALCVFTQSSCCCKRLVELSHLFSHLSDIVKQISFSFDQIKPTSSVEVSAT